MIGNGRKRLFAGLICMVLLLSTLTGCDAYTDRIVSSLKEYSRSLKSGSESGKDRISSIIEDMTLEEKVGQLMIPYFRVWKEAQENKDAKLSVENPDMEEEKVNITELNDELRKCIRDHHYGGIILFAENIYDTEQTMKLISDMQASNREGNGLPLLIAADQEGGNVARIGFGTTGISNMALAATGNKENVRKMAEVFGEELRCLGINTDFAPVLDVNNNPVNPVIGIRSFSDSPQRVAEYGLSFIQGLKEQGVISTLKHFPGHGDTNTDSHTGFPCIDKSYEELKEFELIPFKEAIDNGVDMIMTAHIQYPQIEKEKYISTSTGEEVFLPATMSHAILTDILRDDIGFEGVVVTDALDMAAITDNFEYEDVLMKAINAGADMLIVPTEFENGVLLPSIDSVDITVRLVKEGKIHVSRIDEALHRILSLKEKYGLLEEQDFSVSEDDIKEACLTVGSSEHRELAVKLSREALTLLKNEDAFPIKRKAGDETLLLFSDTCASRAGTGELVKKILKDKGIISEDKELTVMVNNADNEDECIEAAKKANHIILVYRTYNEACLDPASDTGFSSGVFDKVTEAAHGQDKKVILISCQLPYDAARFMDADGIILSYCSSPMKEIPNESGPGSAFAPNLMEAILSCFDESLLDLKGKLPVNIPALDADHHITEKILYSRE